LQDHILATNQAKQFYEQVASQLITPGPVTANSAPTAGFEKNMIILFQSNTRDDTAPLTLEARVKAGDSGSPIFSASGGTLTLMEGGPSF
jgi:hypothetical protein